MHEFDLRAHRVVAHKIVFIAVFFVDFTTCGASDIFPRISKGMMRTTAPKDEVAVTMTGGDGDSFGERVARGAATTSARHSGAARLGYK